MNKNVVIENAEIIFRNFSGKEGKYNPPGRRNFCVLLDDKVASNMKKDGWNIRYLRPRDEEDKERAYMQVSVNYDYRPPKVVQITRNGKTQLGEEEVGMLDWAELEKVDLEIRPYNWDINGKSGIKAYAKAIYATLVEDELAEKYNDIPDTGHPMFEPDDEIPF